MSFSHQLRVFHWSLGDSRFPQVSRCSSLWWDICFSFVWVTFFFLFFPSSLFVWWCPLPIFTRICNFLFLRALWFFLLFFFVFLIRQFYSFSIFLFSIFPYENGIFPISNSIPIHLLFILIVCISSHFFLIFYMLCKQLDNINYFNFL